MYIPLRIRRHINLFLFIASTIVMIAAVSIIFAMVRQINEDERNKVITWVSSVQQKADLIEYSRNFFDQIEEIERERLQFWGEAVLRMTHTQCNAEFEFYRRIVAESTSIPVIVTDENFRILICQNIDSGCVVETYLEGDLLQEFSQFLPIEISYMDEQWYIFYKYPQAFIDLQETLDDVIHSFIDEIATSSIFAAILVVSEDEKTVVRSGNMPSELYADPENLRRTLNRMRAQNTPLKFFVDADKKYFVFYESSIIASRLAYLPIFAFIIFGIFVAVIAWVMKVAIQSENNKLWVGMSRETAHQLGTPLSSLMGWIEVLRSENVDEHHLTEIKKDIDHLAVISERFSKMGSQPKMVTENIAQIVHKSIDYLQPRISSKTRISTDVPANAVMLTYANVQLLEWVLENLVVNAVDAIGTEDGLIDIGVTEQPKTITIDITDNGKGIPKNLWKAIFETGYTTKSRGWGLGLPLCYRIIHNYHKGDIFVKQSTVGEGTTFRITLKK